MDENFQNGACESHDETVHVGLSPGHHLKPGFSSQGTGDVMEALARDPTADGLHLLQRRFASWPIMKNDHRSVVNRLCHKPHKPMIWDGSYHR